MDSKKVLYFLGLLNRETSGHTDEIAEIYKRALDENDDVVRLKMLLNDYTYYREIGNGLYKSGEEMLDKIYAMPSKALEILPQLKQVHESIDNEVRVCNELMHSPLPFSETITVVKKKDTIAYMSALKMIASSSVYLMTLYAGLNPIKNLTWDDTVGIQEMIYAVNTKFLPALCSVRRPNYSWIIRRKRLGGRALFGGDSYYLDYESTRSVEVLCSGLHKEPIGTHAFLNIDAYESGESITYGLFIAQERGTLFIGPGEKVYGGMVVGQNGKTDDIEINVCKTKHLTNTRSSGADEALKLTPPKKLSLEQALEFIDTDELLEITPENIRIRKKILDPTLRYRAKKNKK